MQDVRERVLAILQKHVKVDVSSLDENAELANDLGVDSLTLFEIFLELEKEFNCEIPESAASEITSIKNTVAYIESKIIN